MTTLWARLKIWEATKSYHITEKCAQHFDAILNKYRFRQEMNSVTGAWFPTHVENIDFNGEFGVLHSIGVADSTFDFDVITYISRTTHENKTLAGIIHEDYNNLYSEILRFIDSKNITLQDVIDIQEYLRNSHYCCCKNENDRKNLNMKLEIKREVLEKTKNVKDKTL